MAPPWWEVLSCSGDRSKIERVVTVRTFPGLMEKHRYSLGQWFTVIWEDLTTSAVLPGYLARLWSNQPYHAVRSDTSRLREAHAQVGLSGPMDVEGVFTGF
jgi:hypothetical protein